MSAGRDGASASVPGPWRPAAAAAAAAAALPRRARRNTRDPRHLVCGGPPGAIRDGRLRKSARACLSRSFVTGSGPVRAPYAAPPSRGISLGREMRSRRLPLTRRRARPHRRSAGQEGVEVGGWGNDFCRRRRRQNAAEDVPIEQSERKRTEKLTIALMDVRMTTTRVAPLLSLDTHRT